MAADPTVVAIPFYFGSMEAERRYLKRRAERLGPSAADYTKDDTTASLTMGVASLVVPLASHLLVQHVVPGQGPLRTGAGGHRGRRRGRHHRRRPAGRPRGRRARRPARPRRRRPRRPSRAGPRRPPLGAQGAPRHRPGRGGHGRAGHHSWVSSRTNPLRMWEKGQRHDRGAGPLAWAAAIVGWDFIYYWNHRMMHEVRGHVGASTSSTTRASATTSPPRCGSRWPTCSACGCPTACWPGWASGPALISQARGINLLYQYWIHTDAIRSIGAGEEVLNTPSHHRVHHGSNPQYLDRNHGSILIVWDRLFGTFQREEEPVVYGLTKNIETYNPVRIAGHEYADIVRDVAHSTTWHDRLSFVLRGPGWAYRRHAERAPAGSSLACGELLRADPLRPPVASSMLLLRTRRSRSFAGGGLRRSLRPPRPPPHPSTPPAWFASLLARLAAGGSRRWRRPGGRGR